MNDSTFLNSNTTSNFNQSPESKHKDQDKFNKLEPSIHSVQNILNYSKAISVRKTEDIGFVEHLLN